MGISMCVIDSDFFVPEEHVQKVEKITTDLYDWSWEFFYDDNGNIEDITFTGEKYFSEELSQMNAIAPFVREGSFIHYCVDEEEHYRFYFTGDECLDQKGEVVFPDPPDR